VDIAPTRKEAYSIVVTEWRREMTAFRKFRPSSEKELHGIIEKNIESLEEGLEVLKYEFSIGNGIADFLCKDSGGRLVVIEIKLGEDSEIIFQALRYYADIDTRKYVIAQLFPGRGIDPKPSPRIVLIAEHFSDDLRHLTTLMVPDIELFEYTSLRDSAGVEGIVYHAVSLPKVKDDITEPSKLDDHIKYITDLSLQFVFNSARQKIMEAAPNAEEYLTQDHVCYKYRGKQIAWLTAHRKSFRVGVAKIGERKERLSEDEVKITTGDDDFAEILEDIKRSYTNLEA